MMVGLGFLPLAFTIKLEVESHQAKTPFSANRVALNPEDEASAPDPHIHGLTRSAARGAVKLLWGVLPTADKVCADTLIHRPR
jgi:hypothetical protein